MQKWFQTYEGFLRWALGTREALLRRMVSYVWLLTVIILYVADLMDIATPGFPRTGNWFTILMFSVAVTAVYLDHYEYFWKRSSKPA